MGIYHIVFLRLASNDLDYLIDITRALIPSSEASTEIHFFRGSIFTLMTAVNYYFIRVPRGEARKALAEVGRQETAQHIITVASFILWFYDYIEGKIDKPPPVGAYKDMDNYPVGDSIDLVNWLLFGKFSTMIALGG